MSDDLFGKPHNPDNGSKKYDELSLGNFNSGIKKKIGEKAYATMMQLAAEFFSPATAFGSSFMGELAVLSEIGVSTRKLISISFQTTDDLQDWRKGKSKYSLNEIIQKFTGGFHEFVTEVKKFTNQKRQKIEKETLNLWQNPSFSDDSERIDDDLEREKFDLSHAEISLQSLIHKYSFFVPCEEGISHTDVGSFVESIAPQSTSLQKTFDKLISKIINQDDISIDDYLKLRKKTLTSEDKFGSYTTLSTFLLRSIIISLDSIRSSFEEQLESRSYKKDVVIEALTNNFDYDESVLVSIVSQPEYDIKCFGHDIVMVWQIPTQLSDSAIKNKGQLESRTADIKNMLEKFGGGFNLEVNQDVIVMTISCPKQEAPKEPLCEFVPDSEILEKFKCAFSHPAEIITPKISILDNDISYNLLLTDTYLSDEGNRTSLANVLSCVDRYKTRKPISLLIPHKEKNFFEMVMGDDNDRTTLFAPSSILSNEGSIPNICKIINLECCQRFSVEAKQRQRFIDALPAIVHVANKAAETNSGKLNIGVTFRKDSMGTLYIINEDGDLICKAGYFQDRGAYGGRFCSSKLIHQVLDAYTTITENCIENNPGSNLPSFLVDGFFDELRKLNIHPSPEFISFQKRAVNIGRVLNYNINPLETVFTQIQKGDVAINEDQNGGIILDYRGKIQEEISDDIDFLERNIIQ